MNYFIVCMYFHPFQNPIQSKPIAVKQFLHNLLLPSVLQHVMFIDTLTLCSCLLIHCQRPKAVSIARAGQSCAPAT